MPESDCSGRRRSRRREQRAWSSTSPICSSASPTRCPHARPSCAAPTAAPTPSSTSARPGSRTSLATPGVGIGDHVGLYLRNSVAHLEAMLACYKAARGSDQRQLPLRRRRAALPVRRRRPRRAVPRRRHRRTRVDAVRSPALRLVVVAGSRRVRSDSCASGSAARDLGPRSPDDHYVLYTGGTTGLPEGRRVAPGRHLLRRRSAAGTRAARRSPRPSRSRRRCSTTPRSGSRPFLPPGDAGPAQFVVARARAADARERPVVGARHAARRRQGRALRRAARRHGARARPRRARARERDATSSATRARARCSHALAAQPDRWDTSSLRLLGSGGSILSGDVKDGADGRAPVGARDRRGHRLVGVAGAGGRGHDPQRRAVGVADVRGEGRDDGRRRRPPPGRRRAAASSAGSRRAAACRSATTRTRSAAPARSSRSTACAGRCPATWRRSTPTAPCTCSGAARCASTPAARRCTPKRSRRC